MGKKLLRWETERKKNGRGRWWIKRGCSARGLWPVNANANDKSELRKRGAELRGRRSLKGKWRRAQELRHTGSVQL